MNRNIILTLMLIIAMPLLTGCLFKSGSNPVGETSIAQSQQSAQALSSVKPMIMSSAYTKTSDRKYTFSKSSHKVGHSFCTGVKKAVGGLRVSFLGIDTTDNIFITFEKMMVKSELGVKHVINMESRKVDLLSAGQLSEIIAEQSLPQGVYNYMEYYVKSAEIVQNGVSGKVLIPSRKIRFIGKFEIKDGYTTNLTVRFSPRMLKWKIGKMNFYMMMPVVKISSELVLIPVDPTITTGEVTGKVESLVSATGLAGVNVDLEGAGLSTVTGSDGTFGFAAVPAGVYTMKTRHSDFLDNSIPLEVSAGQVAEVLTQINPAVISSSIGNTGWFSEMYPLADANGQYSEVSLETPVKVDFVSLAFTRAEVKFTAQYHSLGAARCQNFLAASQQVSAETDMGSWWVGNSINSGSFLGEFYARPEPGVDYVIDVTELIRSNPSSLYFLASKNMDVVDIRMTNIQLSIYYR